MASLFPRDPPGADILADAVRDVHAAVHQLVEGGAVAHKFAAIHLRTGMHHGLQQFHEVLELALCIQQGQQLHVHVLLAARRLVDVQHAFALAGGQRLLQRTLLAGLVAGHRIAMRHPEAVGHLVRGDGTEAVEVALVGGQDPVVGRHQDGGTVIQVQHGRQVRISIARNDLHEPSRALP